MVSRRAVVALVVVHLLVLSLFLIPAGGREGVVRVTVVPSPPTQVSANLAGGSDDVRVTWSLSSPETGVDRYEVWRGDAYDPARAGYAKVSPDLPPGTSSWTDVGGAAFGTPHFYYVSAMNASAGGADSDGQAAAFSRPLATTDPHLVSTPVLTTTSPGSLVQGTLSWEVLRTYEAGAPDPWKATYASRSSGDLTSIGLGEGVWVGVSVAGDLRFAGSVPCTAGIPLKIGWNLVGFPSMAARTVADVSSGLTGPLEFEGHDPVASYFLRRLDPTDDLEPTFGYWVRSPVDQNWTVVNDPSPGCAQGGLGTGFVTAQGPELYRGPDRFRVLGGNSYAILSEYLGIGRIDDSNPLPLQRLADASSANLGAIRFWLDVAPSDYWFGETYGIFEADPAQYLAALRQLRDDAAAFGIYLIPVFISGYTQFSDRGGSSIWQLGGPADTLFKDWVRTIVEAFRDDPQILMWEVANEPNLFGQQGPYATDIATILAWMQDKVAFIKSLDPNHLVSGGYNNTSNFDEQDFKDLNVFCDVAVIHIYDLDLYALMAGQGITDPAQAIDEFVAAYVQWAKVDLGMPLMFGEFNGDLSSDPANPYAGMLMEALHRRDVDAGLIWSWEEGLDQYRILPGLHPEIVTALTTWGAQFNTWRGGS